MFGFIKQFGFNKGQLSKTTETNLSTVPEKELSANPNLDPYADKKGSMRYRLKYKYRYRTELGMKGLKDAISRAENPEYFNRVKLYDIYKEVCRDGQVLSQMRTSKNKIRAAGFNITDEKGKELKDKKAYFEHPWFAQYLKIWVDTVFWGHSLVEFDPLNEEKQFHSIHLIPREHVHPWSGMIVLDPEERSGYPYREQPWNNYLVEIGETDDLGLLLIAAREVIWKHYSRTDWSRYSEKFGMPMISIKSTTKDEKELDKLEEMAANFGSNGYVIMDDEDEFDFVETSKSDAYKVYLEMCNYCDQQISKIVSGQTGTSDEKSFVGSAEVHERILEEYILALLRDLQDHINYVLIPFLVKHGYQLTGCKIQFVDLLPRPATNPQPTPAPDNPEKKKLKLNYPGAHQSNCGCELHRRVNLSSKILDLDKLMQKAIENVYNKKIKAGDLDADTWNENVKKLYESVDKGVGKSFMEISYNDSHYELMSQLRYNAAVFAAFKNHQNIAEMVDALRDNSGNLRSFEDYKAAASQIYNQYNLHWLNAEYNSAIATAQSAVKWQDMWSRKDIFPLLRYRAINDDRTRLAHAQLHDVVLPIEDPFWEKYLPPNGWNCRCTVLQIAQGEEKRPKGLPSNKEVPPTFQNNPGLSFKLFSDDSSYYTGFNADEKNRIISTLRSMVLRENSNYLDALDRVRNKSTIYNSHKDITVDDAASLNLYSTRAFQQLNLRVRYSKFDVYERCLRDNINEALDKLPDHKGIVYRIINSDVKPDFILKLLENGEKTFIEKAFMSTSYNKDWAIEKLAENTAKYRIIFVIKSKSGKNIELFSQKGTIFGKKDNQFEVLFKSGSEFNILSHDTIDDVIIIKMEEK